MANGSNGPDGGGSPKKKRKRRSGSTSKSVSGRMAAAARKAAESEAAESEASDSPVTSGRRRARAVTGTPEGTTGYAAGDVAGGTKPRHSHYTLLGQIVGLIAGAASIFGAGYAVSNYRADLFQAGLQQRVEELGQVEGEFKTLTTAHNSLTRDYEQRTNDLGQVQSAYDALRDSVEHDSVADYLRRIVRERRAEWGGHFETAYARATLYLMSTKGASKSSNPSEVYGRIIRWRLGVDRLPPEDEVLLSLTGYAHDAEAMAEGETPGQYIDSRVDQLLFDRDLLDCQIDSGAGFVRQKGILVLGEPAAGKSTLLQYLELEAARRALADTSAPIPVRVDLADLPSVTTETIWQQVDSLTREPGEPGGTPLQMPTGRRYLLLLDGLDEVKFPEQAAHAANEVIKDERVGRVVIASRIINYSVLLHGRELALTDHGYRMALLYGQSLSAVERRVLALDRDQREKLLQVLSQTERRAVWLQFFRLPANFNFAAEIALDSEIAKLVQPNRTQLLEAYIASHLARVGRELAATRARQIETEATLARVAGRLFLQQTKDDRFAFLHVEQSLGLAQGERLTEAQKVQLEAQLELARKAGIIESGNPGQYEFRHAQFLEYYASRSDKIDWKTVPLADVGWREVLLFKSSQGTPEAKDLILRMAAEGEQSFASSSDDSRRDDYLLKLTIECIDSGPYKNDAELSDLRAHLTALREP